jgi:hypothetical protein
VARDAAGGVGGAEDAGPEELIVDFTLKYRGELRRGVNSTELKQHIRESFHTQLQQIWAGHNVLSRIDRSLLPSPVKSEHDKYDLPRPLQPVSTEDLSAFLFRFRIGSAVFVPLVTFPMEAHCYLSVRLGRPARPGSILFGSGDIDNRLKILLDSLRMPQVEQELPAGPDTEMFCLLADDNLVTRLSVTTYRLLTSYSSDDYVDVDIDVTVRAITPMAGTWALLF